MAEIVSFCWIGMELVCAYFFCECFLQRKRWTKYTCAIILLMLAVIYLYSSHPIGMIPPMLLTPVVYFVVSLVCYDGLWQRRAGPPFRFFRSARSNTSYRCSKNRSAA